MVYLIPAFLYLCLFFLQSFATKVRLSGLTCAGRGSQFVFLRLANFMGHDDFQFHQFPCKFYNLFLLLSHFPHIAFFLL